MYIGLLIFKLEDLVLKAFAEKAWDSDTSNGPAKKVSKISRRRLSQTVDYFSETEMPWCTSAAAA